MAQNFYTILTNIGKAKIANATILNQKVDFKTIVLGDGNGQYYEPSEVQTQLRNEVWRGQVSSIRIDEHNPNWVLIESIVPPSTGGFMIREVGLLDESGDLLVISKYPETYKPTADDGTVKDLIIQLILKVANASSITLKIDPTVVLATKQDIIDMGKTKADKVHNHNDLYHTKLEISSLLDNKVSRDIVEYTPILNTGWTAWNNQPLRNICYKIGNIVFLNLSLSLKNPKADNWWMITQLPEGFRPKANIMNVGYIYFNNSRLAVETHLHIDGWVDILGMGQEHPDIYSYGANFIFLSK